MVPVISKDFRQRYKNVSVRLLDSVSLVTRPFTIVITCTYKRFGVATEVIVQECLGILMLIVRSVRTCYKGFEGVPDFRLCFFLNQLQLTHTSI